MPALSHSVKVELVGHLGIVVSGPDESKAPPPSPAKNTQHITVWCCTVTAWREYNISLLYLQDHSVPATICHSPLSPRYKY